MKKYIIFIVSFSIVLCGITNSIRSHFNCRIYSRSFDFRGQSFSRGSVWRNFGNATTDNIDYCYSFLYSVSKNRQNNKELNKPKPEMIH